MKKHFNKNLIMSEEKKFQSSNGVAGFVKNSLMMMLKKLEIIVT